MHRRRDSKQRLLQEVLAMLRRIPFERRVDGESSVLIEGRRLKTMGFQDCRVATPRDGLSLCGGQELSAEASPALIFPNPKHPDIQPA